MKYLATKLTAIGKVELFEESIQTLKPGEALIKVMASGICGSDLHYFCHGGLGSFKEKLPFPIGHEPSGVVVETCEIEWLRVGDRVAIEPGSACGFCSQCLRGKHNLCDNVKFFGARGYMGALSEYVVARENQLAKISPTVTYEEAALLEPLGVAFHALSRSDLKYGETCAIFGAGPIGLSLVNVLKSAGSFQIIVVDRLVHRLEAAKALGADICMDLNGDVVSNIMDATGGRGVDIAYDAAGKRQTIDQCIRIAAKGGKVVLVGIPTYDEIPFNPHPMRTKELDIINVRRSNQTLHNCIHHQKIFGWQKNIVTHRYDLCDVQTAFETASSYADGVIKSMIISNT